MLLGHRSLPLRLEHRISLAPLGLWLGLLTLPGCGGDPVSGSPGGTGGATTTISGGGGAGGAPQGSLEADYCAPLAEVVCKRLVACGCGFVLPTGTLDEMACRAAYTARCMDAYGPIDAAVKSGTASILPDAAHACVAMLDAMTPGCERPRGAIPQALCPTWFTSDPPIGAACDFPICAGGEGLCVNGNCEARPPAGQPCAQGSICAEGLVCIDSTCAVPAKEGASCTTDDACEPPLRCVGSVCAPLGPVSAGCDSASACAEALVCDAASCAPRAEGPCLGGYACGNMTTCAAPRACVEKGMTGAPCDQDDACLPGYLCDLATSKCVVGPAQGQPCVNNVLCGPGLACDGDGGNCAPPPMSGEPCAFGLMGPSICADGLGCNSGVCGPLPEDGQPCTADYRCAAGLGCDFQANGSFCVPLKSEGGSCQTDRTCAEGLYCDFTKGACAKILLAGSPCKDGNECGPAGSCMPGDSGSFECQKLPALGERCLFDCATGLHCASDAAASKCVPDVCKEL